MNTLKKSNRLFLLSFTSNIKNSIFLCALFCLFSRALIAQHESLTPKIATTSQGKATDSAFPLNSDATDHNVYRDYQVKVNVLLRELRAMVTQPDTKNLFQEKLRIVTPSNNEQVCTNIQLLDLINNSDEFIISPNLEKKEILSFIDFLYVMLNEMRAN
jgi:hypothetical protein